MPLIECIPGPAETPIAGVMYSFQRDDYGRYVARVDRFEHMACLLATPHYRQVPDVPEKSFQDFSKAIKTAALQKAESGSGVDIENYVRSETAVGDPDWNVIPGIMDPTAVPADAPAEPKSVPDAPLPKKKGGRPPRTSLGG